MNDRRISLSSTVASAWGFWVLGIGLVLLDLLTEHDLGDLGIVCVAAGGVLHVRSMFCALQRRESIAYEMGQNSVSRLHT